MNDQLKEPEEYISAVKYLAELIQMDLNFGRKETILPRVNAIITNAACLQKLYIEPEPEITITKDEAHDHYKLKAYSAETPTNPGLYLVVCEEVGWVPYFVALIRNDYQILAVHCAELGVKHIDNYCAARTGLMWLKAA
jgi:hypothetical protein